MKFNDYQEKAGRSRNKKVDELTNYALGMVCEAGEVGDIVKKHTFHGHELNIQELKKEMGDTLWYMANICNALNIEFEEIAKGNIDKLLKRYPNGFSQSDSINRKE